MSELLKKLRRWRSRQELDDEPIYIYPLPSDVRMGPSDVTLTGELYQTLDTELGEPREELPKELEELPKELEELPNTYCFIPPAILQQL